MKILTVLLTLRSRAAVIIRCIIIMSLPCGYERSVRKKLRLLYFFRGFARFIMRIVFWSALFLGLWLISTDILFTSSIYRIMSAFQMLPVMLVILFLRLKLNICFASAEVLVVSRPYKGIWKNLCESRKMLCGQYGFIAGVFLRNIYCWLIPFFLPTLIQTLVSYFSVRHIEWQYQNHQENNTHEQANLYSIDKRTYEAGDISAQ